MGKYTGYSPRASLAVVGRQMRRLGIWQEVEGKVHIKQKVLKHTPTDKLLDGMISMLAGAGGLVEINTLVRSDEKLQRAFGRTGCAEQSTVSDTLDACTSDNVTQMRSVLTSVLRKSGQAYRHNYQSLDQLLDVDMTGLVAGRLGEGVTTGYFANNRGARGRQLGRVLATNYAEIVVDHLYNGKRQLDRAFQELILAAEEVLGLTPEQRAHTILRADSGGGSADNINWALERGYPILTKLKNPRSAAKLAAPIERWRPDPTDPRRWVAWVPDPRPFARPTTQVAVRTIDADGACSYFVLVHSLTNEQAFRLAGEPILKFPSIDDLLLASLHAYDRRGGALETQNRADKQGLAIHRRNKRRFPAQEMLLLLAQLAHNLVIWARNALALADPRFRQYGVQRLVRDVLRIPGQLRVTPNGVLSIVTLNELYPMSSSVHRGFTLWLDKDKLRLRLGKI